MKHWHLLHINRNLTEIFQNPPILAFRRNKNLRDIISIKLIENGKVKRKSTKSIQGKSTLCLANNRTLCCKQVANRTTFRSNQMNRIFQIYHNLNCKSNVNVIYLVECTKYKIHYVGKAEPEFNIRLNKHQKDVWKPDAIFQNVIFQTKTVTLTQMIDQIRHIDIDKEKNMARLKQRENF